MQNGSVGPDSDLGQLIATAARLSPCRGKMSLESGGQNRAAGGQGLAGRAGLARTLQDFCARNDGLRNCTTARATGRGFQPGLQHQSLNPFSIISSLRNNCFTNCAYLVQGGKAPRTHTPKPNLKPNALVNYRAQLSNAAGREK